MKRLAAWSVLLALALGAALAARGDGSDLGVPSLDDRGPRGLAVLGAWLAAEGTVLRAQEPLTRLPEGAASLVIAAPARAELDQAEVDAVRRFATAGGTVVYLASRTGAAQPALHRWLGLEWTEAAPPLDEPGVADVLGTTVQVTVPGGLLAGAARLRLAAERQVRLTPEGAVPVTERGAVWWWPVGAGEVWVAAGPELAENARLELLDNALPWAALARRGPVLFDEYHHDRAAAPRAPLTVGATAAQLGLLALLFVLVFGARLGPAREAPPPTHRSALEYVRALARVTAQARVDPELVEVLRARTRALAWERLGVPRALDWGEAARLVAARLPGAGADFVALGQPGTFLSASVHAARVEGLLEGGAAVGVQLTGSTGSGSPFS